MGVSYCHGVVGSSDIEALSSSSVLSLELTKQRLTDEWQAVTFAEQILGMNPFKFLTFPVMKHFTVFLSVFNSAVGDACFQTQSEKL